MVAAALRAGGAVTHATHALQSNEVMNCKLDNRATRWAEDAAFMILGVAGMVAVAVALASAGDALASSPTAQGASSPEWRDSILTSLDKLVPRARGCQRANVDPFIRSPNRRAA